MAAFIIRALYGENFSYTTKPYFSDVPSDNSFFKYIQMLKDVGITSVTGTYGINENVTRGQMAAFIIRALYGQYQLNANGWPTSSENFSYKTAAYFTDVPSTNAYFKYVQKLKDVGITSVSGNYGVDNVVTRDQMAAFLGRAFLGMP